MEALVAYLINRTSKYTRSSKTPEGWARCVQDGAVSPLKCPSAQTRYPDACRKMRATESLLSQVNLSGVVV